MNGRGWVESPLAVVGMACRLPGADGLDAYWDLILRGGCALGPLPESRFDAGLYYDPQKGAFGKSYSRLGGAVQERPFNRNAYPLPDNVIAGSDPVHLAMLEVAGDALRHAGLEPCDLPLRNTGVYVGNARGSLRTSNIACAVHAREIAARLCDGKRFGSLPAARQEQLLQGFGGRLRKSYADPVTDHRDLEAGRVAALVAEAFGLTGPAMAMDAACASSLVALAHAARALQHGRIDMAVVGGASYSGWTSLVMFSQAQALSATGSFPFDARADGFISSDGYAAVVVKTLGRALADGDRVWGVIRGLGLSSDGRGKSLWAPRRAGQVLAIRRGMACGVDVSRTQYVEAHGTATQVGDATELQALTEALGPSLSPSHPVPVASVKGNIGHTRETAGLAGLIKTLLAMQHGRIPPAAGFETPNPEIPWDSIPFHVPTGAADWDKPDGGGPRRAAVDAFGIGGLNVHLLVDGEPESGTSARISVPDVLAGTTIDASPHAGGEAIAVVGRGAIFPGARTLAAFEDLLRSGRDPRVPVPAERWDPGLFGSDSDDRNGRGRPLGGFVTSFEYDWRKHRIPPRQLARADPLQFMVLDAAEQALQDAGWLDRGFDRDGTAVVIGAGFGGDFAIELALALRLPEFQIVLRDCLADGGLSEGDLDDICREFAAAFRERYSALEDETASYSSSTLASRVTKTFDLMGGAFSIDAGGGSSLAAVTAGIDLLRSHECNAVLCAGAQRSLGPCVYDSYRRQRVLVTDAPRPAFDEAANGFVPGEGCGFVLLKRLSDAVRDGDRIHAVIRGIGAATCPADRPQAVRTAADRALADAAVNADAVSVIEATGLAVPELDADEAAGLQAGYGTPLRRQPAWIDSVASRIGYTHGASGMASLLKLLSEFGDRQLHPAACPTQPIQSVADGNGALRIVEHPIPLTSENGATRLLGAVSTLTLNGQAHHLLVECPAPRGTPRSEVNGMSRHRLFRVGAADTNELALKLGGNGSDAVAAFAESGSLPAHHGARLVVVAEDRAALGRKLDLARRSLASVSARPVLEKQGIFVGERRAAPLRIAFAFAGQGSQYAGMLRELVSETPVAATHVQELDATLVKVGLPTFEQLAWENGDHLGRALFETQLSVLLADVLMFRVLTAQGVRPDVITAHSFGEYPALVASGAWDLEQAIETTRARCRAIVDCRVNGGLLATTASTEQVEQLLREAAVADVYVANCNAPEQTVIGGTRDALRRFAEHLQSRGFETKELPVPAPFHTPLMDPVRGPMRTALEAATLRPPATPLLSSVTNRYTADPLDLRENLIEQLVRPVRYVELVRRLVGDGIDVIIEVGPRDVLTKLHRQIIDDDRVGLIATDDPRSAGSAQLLRVQALLECRGHAPPNAHVSVAASTPPTGGNGAVRTPPSSVQSVPIAHFDATAKRRERNRQSGVAAESGTSLEHEDRISRAGAETPPPDDELAGVLVRFVCEHTGYPPEVVDLDAELEADLGIDSIRKAQLLGELREHFPLRPARDVSLDDFPTLRHILEFIRTSQDSAPATAPDAPPSPDLDLSPDHSIVTVLDRAAPARVSAIPAARRDTTDQGGDTAAVALNLKRFRGSPYEMGYQHGRQEEDAIRRVLHKYVDLLGPRLFEMRPLQAALEHRDRFFGDDGLEELRGIADAVGMPVEHVTSFNYGLSMEFLPGCTQFAVTAKQNGHAGLIHAVNEDWMLALALPGTLKRMAQVRFPEVGIPFLTLSTCGELAGQNGINARGLAVSSTLLLDRLRRDEIVPGRVHPALVKCILERANSIDAALEIIRELPRNGAWSMCISQHDADRLCYVEYDPDSVEVRWSDDFVESTNHCLLKSPLSETPDQSCQRLDRLHELLHGENGSPPQITLEQAQAILRDRYDRSLGRVTTHPTKATIRRPYTQASLVMRPATREVWITADSVPEQDPDRFHRLDLSDLFDDETVNGTATVEQKVASVSENDPAQCRSIPDRIMNRFLLRMTDAPLAEDRERSQPVTGRVLLLGDNPTADAVRRQLAESGADVLRLPVDDADRALQRLNQLWSEGPAPTLLLMMGRDEDAGSGTEPEAWLRRREHGVLLPFMVCQRWVQLVTRDSPPARPRLVAVTGLGGDLGLSGRSAAIEGGALSGLLKAVRHEFDRITTKVVDAPLEDPPQLVARCLLEELESAAPDVEVAYVCGRRRVLQPVPRNSETRFLEETGFLTRPHGTWIVTGGGRGVTAIVARELGRRYGLKLHLIGSSPAPEVPDEWRDLSAEGRRELRGRITRQAHEEGRDPAAAWRDVERGLELDASLRTIADAGVSAAYHTCDVSDRDQLAGLLDGIRAADGPIHGVIHGAGFEAACRFDKKTREAVYKTLAIKVDGAINLAALTREDPVQFFVGFGSISGRFGGHGQTDYSMSSDLLAKVMSRLRHERPDCRAVAVHWPVWDEVGMAMRPESKLTLEIAGHRFMPPLEGVAHLIDELEAGAPEGEVLLFDWPATRGSRRSPWTPDEARAYWRRTAAVADAPLIRDVVHVDEGHRIVTELRFDPRRDPFLTHHRFLDVPILPLVIALEAFAETASLLQPDATVNTLRDVRIHDGMRFPSGATECARVNARVLEGGRASCELRSDFRNRHGVITDPSRLHVSGMAGCDGGDPAATVDWTPPVGKWADMIYDPQDARAIQRMIWHGPPFQCLKEISVADDTLWGRILAPPLTDLCPSPHNTAWRLPSAVLDACLLSCSILTYVRKGPFHLPQAVTELRFGRSPQAGEECVVMVRFRGEQENRATFDFTLYGEDQSVILDAQGYHAAFISTAQGAP